MVSRQQATNVIVVPPRMCLVTPKMVDDLAEDLRAELPGYKFHIVPDYIGRQSHEYFVEPDGWVPDEAVAALRSVLARYGDKL
ncbi:hypothetical protein EN866_33095 [Mesorhizobium sp. M2D.F.Ca.ET.223.01.1.1]|uniref:hypothetical protein n=1 Tax=Mesorhizobium sp. M2D.F.Ca.ET.223.01.1.1 TaxID=2563940 RepID=UPI001092AF19|nr:hypothetical protein [Mesorhizobium sp. M2D.F.Ca.ET.223.01.1.1]TGR84588.1 hypothetical protein EN866_33095 [Mesorhizobium sp. M2D.F.Ca.ET.223.01.1.1]TGT75154.1 hypothetical protein EN802_09115 [bacterium M00.F.Ca.ET.159.01.1.1]TGT88021.1 hypothetical protein EN800_06005 [bacterium M00.F.Ca.ET.157.01.1.1]